MSGWLVYWVLMLDSVVILFTIVLGLTCFLIVGMVLLVEDDKRNSDNFMRGLKELIVAAIICALLVALIPNTKQAACIYVIPKIVNNERIQKIPDKLLRLGEQKLDELLSVDGDEK